MVDQLPSLAVKPIIRYPREAQVGKTYLMTIDLQPEEGFEWQYEEEEYPIYCSVDSDLFSSRPVGEPVIIFHRFGGSYGEVKFLLTATEQELKVKRLDQRLNIGLVNRWGVPIKVIHLEDISLVEFSDKLTSLILNKVDGQESTSEDLDSETFLSSPEVGQVSKGSTVIRDVGRNFYAGDIHYHGVKPLQPGYPFQAPPLPNPFVDRPEHRLKVKQELLSDQERRPGTLVVSAIAGLGGIGKTVLASALAHDADIQARFSDGILWASLGQAPDLLSLVDSWIRELKDYDYKPTTVETASMHLRTLLYDKKMLLVVDDVWNPEHAEPFRVGGAGCQVLVTTREAKISGAARYELDVMTEAEALDLLARSLPEPLNEAEQAQALALAKEVGYLPLALQLAAGQIEDGVSWSDLLHDLRAEVARLETLDALNATTVNETQRRKYSLLASFNLSLRQLTPEQLQQFAWLGVLPEDVLITQPMAATLWEVTPRQAGAVLRTMKSKALLLLGPKQGEQQTFRLHDLMHDCAQRLLRSSPTPEQADDLPGLGLTRPAAHAALLERYRHTTTDGQWYSLPDDGYIHAHLTWHLEHANWTDEIHALMAMEDAQGRNAWFEVCDRIGQPKIFIKDLERARSLAQAIYANNPGRSQELQKYYDALKNEVFYQVQAISPSLMVALVESGHWSIEQVWNYLELTFTEEFVLQERDLDAIQVLLAYLPGSLLQISVSLIKAINDPFSRAKLLLFLAQKDIDRAHFSELLRTARSIQNEFSRASILRDLAQIDATYFAEALSAARSIQSESDRASALAALVPYLPEALLSQALETARSIQSESDRASALAALVPYLPEALLSQALETARSIQSESDRASALAVLVPYLPEALPEALETARSIQSESDRASALAVLVPYLPEALPEALETARSIQSESDRASALAALVPYLPEALLSQALETARSIQSESDRASALAALVPYLPEALLSQALETARSIQSESDRASILRDLAQIDGTYFAEALSAARSIQDESSRVDVLCDLAQANGANFAGLLAAARAIQSEFSRARILGTLAQINSLYASEALEAAHSIADKETRLEMLTLLAQKQPHLSIKVLEAVRLAR